VATTGHERSRRYIRPTGTTIAATSVIDAAATTIRARITEY